MKLFRHIPATLGALAIMACGSAEGTQPPSSSMISDPPAASAAYTDTVSQEGYMLCWRADDSILHVMMSAPTTGWVAVGFHSEGAMKNANIVIGYVTGTTVHLRDDYGIDYIAHADDVSLGGTENVSLVGGSEGGGRTTISFTIPLSTGDDCDRELTPGEDCDIIIANGPNGSDGFTEKHQWAGVATITI